MSDIPADIQKTADGLYRRYYRLTNSVTLSALVGSALLTERQSSAALIKELVQALERADDFIADIESLHGCDHAAGLSVRAALAKAKERT